MAGPTPVSALIHAATMVTAGIYMIARSGALYSLAPMILHVVAVIGLVTAIVAATIAIKQYDIKKVLAYSNKLSYTHARLFIYVCAIYLRQTACLNFSIKILH